MPKFLQMVQDRDLWKFAIPETKPFADYIHTVPFEFEKYKAFLDETTVQNAIEKGKGKFTPILFGQETTSTLGRNHFEILHISRNIKRNPQGYRTRHEKELLQNDGWVQGCCM